MITVAPASCSMRWSCNAIPRLASASRRPVGPVAPPGGCPGSSAIRRPRSGADGRWPGVGEHPAGDRCRPIGYGSHRVTFQRRSVRCRHPGASRCVRSGCRSARIVSSRCRPRPLEQDRHGVTCPQTRETAPAFPRVSGRWSGSAATLAVMEPTRPAVARTPAGAPGRPPDTHAGVRRERRRTSPFCRRSATAGFPSGKPVVGRAGAARPTVMLSEPPAWDGSSSSRTTCGIVSRSETRSGHTASSVRPAIPGAHGPRRRRPGRARRGGPEHRSERITERVAPDDPDIATRADHGAGWWYPGRRRGCRPARRRPPVPRPVAGWNHRRAPGSPSRLAWPAPAAGGLPTRAATPRRSARTRSRSMYGPALSEREAEARRTFRMSDAEVARRNRDEPESSVSAVAPGGGAASGAGRGTQASQAPLGHTFTGCPFMLRVASPVPTLPSRKVESRASIVASSAGYWTTMRVGPVTGGWAVSATEPGCSLPWCGADRGRLGCTGRREAGRRAEPDSGWSSAQGTSVITVTPLFHVDASVPDF